MNPILKIDDHPFYIGSVTNDNYDLPLTLPFYMGIHETFSIPRLILSNDIKTALSDLYEHGSFASTPLGESVLSTKRMDQFLEKLISIMGGDVSNKKLLEIGCGEGKLLFELKKRGAIVKGIEIGPQSEIAKNKYGLDILNEPLSKEGINDKFDCIFSYGCLEHIDDLESFFEGSRSCLNNNGLFFHSVPNSQLSFERFDLDNLVHQHINYFTPKNGVILFDNQGFKKSSYSLTNNKNELMIWGFFDINSSLKWPLDIQKSESDNLKKYKIGLDVKTNNIRSNINEMLNNGESIGFYAGGSEYGFYFRDKNNIRYFDSDDYKFGLKLLRGLPKIEPPINLIEERVDNLIICKPHYFDEIYESLVNIGVEASSIINIQNLK